MLVLRVELKSVKLDWVSIWKKKWSKKKEKKEITNKKFFKKKTQN
jgi:hypothetical protein